VTTQTIAEKVAGSWNHPGAIETYRLYPGGEEYEVPRLGDTLENISLEPDPQINPLGLFVREGDLELRSNVNVAGGLIVTQGVRITGQNVQVQSRDLPAIVASGPQVRLPALIMGELRVASGANATIRGNVLAWDKAEVEDGSEATRFDLRGRLVSARFTIGRRTQWEATNWSDLHGNFLTQLVDVVLNLLGQSIHHFPNYAGSNAGRQPAPRIVLAPPTTPRLEQFLGSQPVYAPAAGDAGLRWELIDWKDEG
jgi:hypothetical protein